MKTQISYKILQQKLYLLKITELFQPIIIKKLIQLRLTNSIRQAKKLLKKKTHLIQLIIKNTITK